MFYSGEMPGDAEQVRNIEMKKTLKRCVVENRIVEED